MCIFIYITYIYLYIYTHIYWYHVKVHSFGASRFSTKGATRSCRAEPWRTGQGAESSMGFLLQDGPRIQVING